MKNSQTFRLFVVTVCALLQSGCYTTKLPPKPIVERLPELSIAERQKEEKIPATQRSVEDTNVKGIEIERALFNDSASSHPALESNKNQSELEAKPATTPTPISTTASYPALSASAWSIDRRSCSKEMISFGPGKEIALVRNEYQLFLTKGSSGFIEWSRVTVRWIASLLELLEVAVVEAYERRSIAG